MNNKEGKEEKGFENGVVDEENATENEDKEDGGTPASSQYWELGKDNKGEGDVSEISEKEIEEIGKESEHAIKREKQLQITELTREKHVSWKSVEKYLVEHYNTKELDQLSIEQMDEIIERLEKRERKKVEVEKNVEEKKDEYVFEEIDPETFKCLGPDGSEHILTITKPECDCIGFFTGYKNGNPCIHLKEAKKKGYNVAELPEVPKEVKEALVKVSKKKPKPLIEETVSLSIMDKSIEMPVQTPEDIIQNEEKAVQMIKAIVGDHPKFGDVIEKFGDIEEVSADVVRGLAQYSGIRYMPLSKEVEIRKMNLGTIYKATPMRDEDKKKSYEALADLMPESDVTIRCKITMVAAWKDKNGGLRVGFGTKEEHLTVYDLKDMVTRGTNFIETMCESKSIKKAVLNALPITHDGLLSKIKQTFGWS